MRGAFSLRTVRKKVLLLSKLAGAALIASYLLSAGLPVSEDASFLIWLGFVSLLVVGIDLLMGRFITRPLARLNASAKRMAGLDFSAPCDLASTDEFGELSASLNTMAENLQQALARLEGALDERRELVDSLSHEMKTPLGIIRAYAEGLQDETDEAKKQKYARIIVSETERMNGTRFDFVELAETVAGRLLLDAPGTDFALDYALPEGAVYVRADRRRMEQALGNLLVNARKNVRPGGTLRLEVAAQGGALHVSVFNQGRQIPQEELPRIWTKFYRDSGVSYSGSGLGLSITAQILSMHSMPYGAENREDGVRFYFSLPIAEGAF